MQPGGWGSFDENHEGQNHPNGVIFNYHISQMEESTAVKIEILEIDGTSVMTFSNQEEGENSLNAEKGGNYFVWNMRYPGFTAFPGMVLYSSPNVGPKAVPGIYKARLTVNGESMEQEFRIIPDPRLKNTQEDYQRQFDVIVSLRDKVSEAHQAILDIRTIRKDLDYLKTRLKDDETMKDIVNEVGRIDEEITAIENSIHQTKNQSRQDALNYGIRVNNRLAFLMGDQQRGASPPTDQALQVRDELIKELDGYLQNLEQILTHDIQNLNSMVRDKGLPMVKEPKDVEVVN